MFNSETVHLQDNHNLCSSRLQAFFSSFGVNNSCTTFDCTAPHLSCGFNLQMLFASEVLVDELVGLMMDLPLCVSKQILDVRLIDGRFESCWAHAKSVVENVILLVYIRIVCNFCSHSPYPM